MRALPSIGYKRSRGWHAKKRTSGLIDPDNPSAGRLVAVPERPTYGIDKVGPEPTKPGYLSWAEEKVREIHLRWARFVYFFRVHTGLIDTLQEGWWDGSHDEKIVIEYGNGRRDEAGALAILKTWQSMFAQSISGYNGGRDDWDPWFAAHIQSCPSAPEEPEEEWGEYLHEPWPQDLAPDIIGYLPKFLNRSLTEYGKAGFVFPYDVWNPVSTGHPEPWINNPDPFPTYPLRPMVYANGAEQAEPFDPDAPGTPPTPVASLGDLVPHPYYTERDSWERRRIFAKGEEARHKGELVAWQAKAREQIATYKRTKPKKRKKKVHHV